MFLPAVGELIVEIMPSNQLSVRVVMMVIPTITMVVMLCAKFNWDGNAL